MKYGGLLRNVFFYYLYRIFFTEKTNTRTQQEYKHRSLISELLTYLSYFLRSGCYAAINYMCWILNTTKCGFRNIQSKYNALMPSYLY